MKRPRPARPERPVQTTSKELVEDLLQIIRTKFYLEHPIAFAKDRPRLLSWVVLYPAGWLKKRGVTLPPERYKAILVTVLLDAARFGQTTKVTYFPAYLRQVVQSHFQVHGDEYYEEAKSVRNLVEHAVLVAGQARGSAAPDPVAELAAAAQILRLKTRKTVPKPPLNTQLNLL